MCYIKMHSGSDQKVRSSLLENEIACDVMVKDNVVDVQSDLDHMKRKVRRD